MATIDGKTFAIDLNDKSATNLDVVGGKGANLAILYQRGFSVPDAFIVTTDAFQYIFNNEQIQIALSIIDHIDVDNIKELENISSHIKITICNVILPNDMIDTIMGHYEKLCQKLGMENMHVAVRSSATAEDLPDNSFAGQQDTYLHVTKEDLIEKVKECWASLFTARAISYRKKSNINHKIVKLAVVVQQMISSEVSGVAFTANPITGFRHEVVIDSTYGLGEALVSGLVTPDHYEVHIDERGNAEIRVKKIGEKSIHIIGKSNGGTETILTHENDKVIEALSDHSIIQLAKLAKQIEKSYNFQPQDLEWSFTKNNLYILQSRPITTLFPIPIHARNQSNLRCLLSFGTIQGFLEPMTPLGQSTIRTLLCNFIREIGINNVTSIEDDISSNPLRHNLIKSSANRLWVDLTPVLSSPLSRNFSISMVDTGMSKIVRHLIRTKTFQINSIFSSFKSYLFLLWFIFNVLCKSIRNLIFPRYGKNLYMNEINKYHSLIDRNFNENNKNFSECVNHFHNSLLLLSSTICRYAAPCLFPSVLSLKILEKLSADPADSLALTRAVESNPTTEMNLNLWKIAQMIKENRNSLNLFETESTIRLVELYHTKSFETHIQLELDGFFRMYGCRGIGEIDIGRKRWLEEPKIVIEQIKNYLKITNPNKGIDRVHDQSKQTAYEALNRIESQLKHPWFQRPLLNILFDRLKILFSIRESPKFHGLIQTFAKCRQHLYSKATLSVKENFINHIDDITFLYIEELKSLASDTDNKNYDKISFWKCLIAQRRNEYNKTMQCKRIPLILLSNGTTYYDSTMISDENDHLTELAEGEYLGSPVSPGLYEGKVRIVDDPINSQLQPGEILVCTATDPAWTSLFPLAGALVLEMGGMLQHGAIVSREYGLPAVVGVANAKTLFHNGQTIQVNGSNGRIKILSD